MIDRLSALALACLLAAAGAARPAMADLTSASFTTEWGHKSPQELGGFYFPVGNAVHDATGDVYVTESNRVQKFTRDGAFIFKISCGCAGVGVNQSTGDFYITLDKADGVEQYTSAGVFVRSWGTSGTGVGEFNAPWGVAIDDNTGNVYVMDSGNARVQVFDSTGVFLFQFTSGGLNGGPGEPGGIAFDPANNWVYVTDAGNDIVEKFDAAGSYLGRIGTLGVEGCTPGIFRWTRGVAVDSAGRVYVTSNDCEKIDYFDSSGTFLGTFMGPNNVIDGASHPRDVSINRLTDEKFVNAGYAWRVDRFNDLNEFQLSFGGHEFYGHAMLQPRGIAVSPVNGDVYVFDALNFRIKRFTAGGAFLNMWGQSITIDNSQPGLFGSFIQSGLAVDSTGNPWAGLQTLHYPDDPTLQYVQQFDPLGNHLQSFLRTDVTGKYTERVPDVEIDQATGEVWIADATRNTVKKFDSSGSLLVEIFAFSEASGVAVSATHVYAADHVSNTIKKFDKTGVPGIPASFGGSGSADGLLALESSTNLATDSAGNIYVADTGNDRIQQFDPAGNFVAKFGVSGNLTGQFLQPMQLSLSADDNLLHVVDRGRNRVLTLCLNPSTAVCEALLDLDSDLVFDFPDNCPFTANPGQDDDGGLLSAVADGIGNPCQCGEVDDDGQILAADLVAMRDFLVGVGAPIASDRCSVIGASECDVADAAVLARALASLEPGLSQVCAPAVP